MLEKNGEVDICSCVALPYDGGLGEAPDQMIEGGHHILNSVAQDGYHVGYSGGQNPSFINVHLPIRIVSMGKRMRVVVTQCQSFDIKVIDVQFGAIEFDDSAIESIHQLPFAKEGISTAAQNHLGQLKN